LKCQNLLLKKALKFVVNIHRERGREKEKNRRGEGEKTFLYGLKESSILQPPKLG
jgi:hypothetical protein